MLSVANLTKVAYDVPRRVRMGWDRYNPQNDDEHLTADSFRRTDHMTSPLAATVKKLRKEAGLSQRVLAEKAGLERGWVAALENGGFTNPTIEKLDQLAGALGLTTVELLGGERQSLAFLTNQLDEAEKAANKLIHAIGEAREFLMSEAPPELFPARRMAN